VPTFYVPGNHDFYWWQDSGPAYTMADQVERGRDLAAKAGIHLLMDDAIEIAGVRIVGSTLWTDFRVGVMPGMMTHALRTAEKGMNDYRRIRTGPTTRHRLRPADTIAMHRASRAFLDRTLALPFAGPTVVVSHNAPDPGALPDWHADLSWCYASEMGDLIAERQPAAWIHGHLHRHRDVMLGATRMVANPRGYPGEQTGFRPGMVVEIV
jgi:Icc-related predicted phosphoesterase